MKELLQNIGFSPKENIKGIFIKKYSIFDDYIIEVDFENKKINYGNKINIGSKTTQNFSQDENWVVLECVNRLLEKGYHPKDITLEKVYPTGHGTSGRLDILVKKDKEAFLMIECKTWSREFEKEFSKLQKNGGQLFTYFQQDTNTENLILYTSRFNKNEIEFKNEIIKIEDDYREAGNVKDLYDRWNKLTKTNGIFDNWVNAYEFKTKSLFKKDLKPLTKEDSSSLFNKFDSILRKHSVSDHPNAFNKIFNLFLAKIFDEKKRDNDELDFQWKEGIDDAVEFQVRLINLYKAGVLKFLEKEIEGIKDSDFKYTDEEDLKKKKKKLLMFNKIFDIKEVFDNDTFEDNNKVLKEFVELLSKYQIRYPRKQQHLSNFFEKLLTTGLKQRSGQFFTPPPIARYILKSLPLKQIIEEKLSGEVPELPTIIDYACGSGHFLTEAMEEVQKNIDNIDYKNLYPDTVKKIKSWSGEDQFDWAAKYIYGIEKDYRLVKVAKVGCYFYGDGLAQVVYGDGLDNFHTSRNYRGLLKQKENSQDHPKFDFVISNPPYSVKHFKNDIKNQNPKESFNLFDSLTDQSSEIECLFVERTKQLLKDGGIVAIILPSSILSNVSSIYTKTREILLKYFEFVGITELGSSTFMATGTNTVILFLKRRNNNKWKNMKNSIDSFFINFIDVTVNGQENIFSKYVSHVWKEINLEDYITLCQKNSNKRIQDHEIFIEYSKKLKVKNKNEFFNRIIEIEKEKLLYFILTYPQKIVLVKTGEKQEEKQFLGYKFSNRREHEGIHPIQGGKTIDESTSLFDLKTQENPEKANFYTYKNFLNEDFKIDKTMQKNIFKVDLVDMMTFDRINFEKTISLNVKKNIKIESKLELINLGEVIFEQKKSKIKVKTAKDTENGIYNFFTSGKNILKYKNFLVDGENIYLSTGGIASIKYFKGKASYSTDTFVINSKNENSLKTKLIFYFIENIIDDINKYCFKGQSLKHLQKTDFRNIKIPIPKKNIQEEIVKAIEELEKKEEKNKKRVEELKNKSENFFNENLLSYNLVKLDDILTLQNGKQLSENDRIDGNHFVYGGNGIIGKHNKYISKNETIAIGRVGAYCGVVHKTQPKSWITDNSMLVASFFQEINLDFLYLSLVKLNLNQFASQSSHPNISQSVVLNKKIPLPPLTEQQKIVTKIEKIEQEISELEKINEIIPKQKEEVLKKYL